MRQDSDYKNGIYAPPPPKPLAVVNIDGVYYSVQYDHSGRKIERVICRIDQPNIYHKPEDIPWLTPVTISLVIAIAILWCIWLAIS